MKTGKSTSTPIQIAGLIFAGVVCIAAVMVLPEFRQFLGLNRASEHPATTNPPPGEGRPSDIVAQARGQGAQPAKETLYDYFPVFIGSRWTYNVSTLSEAEESAIETIGTYTETIVTIETGPSDQFQVMGIKLDGENPFRYCEKEPGSPAISPDAYYAMNQEQLYIVCTRSEAFQAINQTLAASGGTLPAVGEKPDFVFPFEVGKMWPAFPEDMSPPDDPFYKWYVEDMVDVTTPAGHFSDCYRLVLFTLPDTSFRWVCPGVGLVAAEYFHHGTVMEIRAELASYQLGNRP
jgi:hypothetical protein